MCELYTAAALLIASVLTCLLLWRQRGHPGWLFVAGLLGGLSPGVHDMVALAAAGAGLLAEIAGKITSRLLSLRKAGGESSSSAETVRLAAGIGVVGLAIFATVAPFVDDTFSSIRAGRITFLDGTPFGEYPFPVRDPDLPRRAAAAIVDQLEEGAIVFTDWAYLYPCIYVARVERHRTDLAFHMCVPDPGGRLPASCIDYIRAIADHHPIYFTRPPEELQRWFKIREVDSEPRLFRLDPWPD